MNKIRTKIAYLLVACGSVFIVLFLVGKYVTPLLNCPRIFSYSNEQIKYLEKQIHTDDAWKNFLHIFPNARQSASLPHFFQQGVSNPVFLAMNDIPYYEGFSLDLWLVCVVSAGKRNISFQYVYLMVKIKKSGRIIASYNLTEDATYSILNHKDFPRLVTYFRDNLFNPDNY